MNGILYWFYLNLGIEKDCKFTTSLWISRMVERMDEYRTMSRLQENGTNVWTVTYNNCDIQRSSHLDHPYQPLMYGHLLSLKNAPLPSMYLTQF